MNDYNFVVALILPCYIYLFDAIIAQYIIDRKVTSVIRKERKGEIVSHSEWQTNDKVRFVVTIIFWALGFSLSISLFEQIGFLGLIILTYCYGALPWIYYYDVKKTYNSVYVRRKCNRFDDRPGCVIFLINIFKPLFWFVYSLIFYIKDFINSIK